MSYDLIVSLAIHGAFILGMVTGIAVCWISSRKPQQS